MKKKRKCTNCIHIEVCEFFHDPIYTLKFVYMIKVIDETLALEIKMAAICRHWK